MLLKKSTNRNRPIYLGATSLGPTITISKDGGSFGGLSGSVSELSGGWYNVALDATDTNTSGTLAFSSNAGTPDNDMADQVVDALPGEIIAVASVVGNVGGSVQSVTGDVGGSVAGNIGGSVGGSVQSVVGQVSANLQAINSDSNSAMALYYLLATRPTYTVDAFTFAPTTTEFETSDVVDSDIFTDQLIYWIIYGVTSRVLSYAYTGNNKVKLTLDAALPFNPSHGYRFVLVGRLEAGSGLDAAGVRAAVGLTTNNLDTQLAEIEGETDAILAKTNLIPASPAATGDAMALTTGERNAIAAALLDLAAGVETGTTPRQALRLMLAALVGKLSGAATTTVKIRDTGDSKDRVTATVDSDGNRSAVVLDVS